MNGRNNVAGRKASGYEADRDGDRFFAIPHVVVQGHKYDLLSLPAKALLVSIAARVHNGPTKAGKDVPAKNNNGKVAVSFGSFSAAEPNTWRTKSAFYRALHELEEAGFAVRTIHADKTKGIAACFALTWMPLGGDVSGIDPALVSGWQKTHRGSYKSDADAPGKRPEPAPKRKNLLAINASRRILKNASAGSSDEPGCRKAGSSDEPRTPKKRRPGSSDEPALGLFGAVAGSSDEPHLDIAICPEDSGGVRGVRTSAALLETGARPC